jgi:hypothetical protein
MTGAFRIHIPIDGTVRLTAHRGLGWLGHPLSASADERIIMAMMFTGAFLAQTYYSAKTLDWSWFDSQLVR